MISLALTKSSTARWRMWKVIRLPPSPPRVRSWSSLFKIYIDDTDGLELPSDQSLKPLWRTASKHLGFDPSATEDEDIKKVLSGLNSVVDGIGSLRTHAGSAHGRGRRVYRLQVRHARLAIHASHTLVSFFLETWDERNQRAGS